MKQQTDKFTSDFFAKPTRGRPRKPNARTGSQRQADYRARQKNQRLISVTSDKKDSMKPSPSQLTPEDQTKNFTLSYPEFCLLIEVVAAQANSNQDSSGIWTRLYKRLGGEG